jgi:hypothetical protein
MIIIVEIYLEILIISYFGILYLSFESSGEVVSFVLASLLFGFSLTFTPILFIYVWTRPIDSFKDEEFVRTWAVFIDHVRIDKGSLMFRGFFLMRRFLLFVVIFFVRVHVGIQMMLILYMNLIMSLYQGIARPFNRKLFNAIEFTNEVLITYAFYCFLAFTDFVGILDT